MLIFLRRARRGLVVKTQNLGSHATDQGSWVHRAGPAGSSPNRGSTGSASLRPVCYKEDGLLVMVSRGGGCLCSRSDPALRSWRGRRMCCDLAWSPPQCSLLSLGAGWAGQRCWPGYMYFIIPVISFTGVINLLYGRPQVTP